jgi:hypothetical protein
VRLEREWKGDDSVTGDESWNDGGQIWGLEASLTHAQNPAPQYARKEKKRKGKGREERGR